MVEFFDNKGGRVGGSVYGGSAGSNIARLVGTFGRGRTHVCYKLLRTHMAVFWEGFRRDRSGRWDRKLCYCRLPSPNRILRREFPISRPVYVIKPQTGFSIPQGSPSPVVRRSVFRRSYLACTARVVGRNYQIVIPLVRAW